MYKNLAIFSAHTLDYFFRIMLVHYTGLLHNIFIHANITYIMRIRRYLGNRVKRFLIIGCILLVTLFLVISYLHAYAFTHPTTNKYLAVERNGMELTSPNLVKATIIGIRPIKHITKETPSIYQLSYENVSFNSSDGLSIKGWLIKSDNPQGTIIMAHGYNGNRGRLDIATFLNEEGYNILMFDFRGHGESEGDYISMGYYESKDILGAIQYLKQRNDTDTNKLYGLGQSMGSAALIFAEEQQPSFKGLILESTYTDLYQNNARRFKRVYGFPKFPFATSLTFFGGIVLGVNGFKISPLNSINNIEKPILLIHDSLDDGVSNEDAKLLFEAANQPRELWIVEGAKHTSAFETGTKEYKRRILNFLNKS